MSDEKVSLKTTMGDIVIQLDAAKAPVTVGNFLEYAQAGFFDGTIFHRVIPDFMLQGGGLTGDMSPKETRDPIANEATNGLCNERGTVAMARTGDPNSATAQFFINLSDNDFLNHGGRDFGYAVFGRVVEGMDVVDAIGAVATCTTGGHQDVPVDAVTILEVTIDD